MLQLEEGGRGDHDPRNRQRARVGTSVGQVKQRADCRCQPNPTLRSYLPLPPAQHLSHPGRSHLVDDRRGPLVTLFEGEEEGSFVEDQQP